MFLEAKLITYNELTNIEQTDYLNPENEFDDIDENYQKPEPYPSVESFENVSKLEEKSEIEKIIVVYSDKTFEILESHIN